ncbi:SCP2 sterol-binding domain-containing protein [Rubrobacter aplysinae]|uniref:SCP2 sterol-binding domain-containing protein n=1 Tax=Rubrobacter aplysinae TaxID=909625 RepID=UPI00069D7C76|nr:SCP2 sterol-binding domain-containing protein [Rubrobacter aplysinae]
MPEYGSAKEYFDHISQEVTPDQAKSLNGLFKFNIKDAGDWIFEFTESGDVGELSPADDVHPDCTITSSEKDWLDIVSGRTKPMSAFVTGKLKVQGATNKAMKLQQILGAQ